MSSAAFAIGGVVLGVVTAAVLSYFPGKPMEKTAEYKSSDDDSSDTDSDSGADAPQPAHGTDERQREAPVSAASTGLRRRKAQQPSPVVQKEDSKALVTAAEQPAEAPRTVAPSTEALEGTALKSAIFGTDDPQKIEALMARARRKAERQVGACKCQGRCLCGRLRV